LGEDFPTTKNTKKSQADGLVQIFVLFVSFVVNIGLRLGRAGFMRLLLFRGYFIQPLAFPSSSRAVFLNKV
jgi:hypothetical protein